MFQVNRLFDIQVNLEKFRFLLVQTCFYQTFLQYPGFCSNKERDGPIYADLIQCLAPLWWSFSPQTPHPLWQLEQQSSFGLKMMKKMTHVWWITVYSQLTKTLKRMREGGLKRRRRRLLFCPDVSGAADCIVLQLLIISNLLLLMVQIQRNSCLLALVEEE